MIINYELYGNCFWHEDCTVARQGIMKPIKHEDNYSQIECLHCGMVGLYPKGKTGNVTVELEGGINDLLRKQRKPMRKNIFG